MMRFLSALFPMAMLVVLSGPGSAQEKAAQDDAKKLQGTWSAVSMAPKDLTADELKKMKVVFDGSTMTMDDGKDKEIATFKLDPSKKPKEIDLTNTDDGPNKGKTILAIYELDGDSLRICSKGLKGARPTEFIGSKETILLVLKRAK